MLHSEFKILALQYRRSNDKLNIHEDKKNFLKYKT